MPFRIDVEQTVGAGRDQPAPVDAIQLEMVSGSPPYGIFRVAVK